MSRTVTALYSSREEADRALRALNVEVSLAHGDVYDRTPESAQALGRIDATDDERAHFEHQMAGGEYMLVAQVRSGEDSGHIVDILERIAADGPPREDIAADAGFAQSEGEFVSPGAGMRGAPAEEERVPIVEEELRVGTQEVVRGGARVRSHVEQVPVLQDVELLEEFARVERRPVMRPISEEDVEANGLLRDRVIEVAQMREEPLINREAFVREEVVITKSIERRVEQIDETVRRTEVDVDQFRDPPAFRGLSGAPGDPPR